MFFLSSNFKDIASNLLYWVKLCIFELKLPISVFFLNFWSCFNNLMLKKFWKYPFFCLKKDFFQNFSFKKIYHRVIDIHQVSWDTSGPLPALGTQSCLCLCIVTLCANICWVLPFRDFLPSFNQIGWKNAEVMHLFHY